MLIHKRAPSERADACRGRQLCLAGLPHAEAEKISLMFEIMGWAVVGDGGPGLQAAESRLAMQRVGNIITVACDDDDVRRTLAAAGLDRLVMPVSLPVLEQLMVFAG